MKFLFELLEAFRARIGPLLLLALRWEHFHPKHFKNLELSYKMDLDFGIVLEEKNSFCYHVGFRLHAAHV